MRERVEGPTPNGGAYAVAVYLRGDMAEEVDKADADTMVITEYDEQGRFVHETVAACKPSRTT
jgi:hypothetical protein